jgi:hypothetical protein
MCFLWSERYMVEDAFYNSINKEGNMKKVTK